jgi:hypothetical protein
MQMLTPIENVIPQSTIIVFSPHYDDFLFMLGGYVTELKKKHLLDTKSFHIHLLFSRSNYLAGTGNQNFDKSLDRIKLATGKRILEDQECIDELLGEFNYTYQLHGERECFARGKSYADSEMEFPHGMYEDFDALDKKIFERMQSYIRPLSLLEGTALVFPIAFKEHVDHFITREAAITTATDAGQKSKATFYFQEDKPYGGLADDKEQKRIEDFVKRYALEARSYHYDPEIMIDLAFKHYISQVEEVYKKGIRLRSAYLQRQLNTDRPCDRIYAYHPGS